MNRKNGTSKRVWAGIGKRAIRATYRELAPSPELRRYVRAYFLFTPAASAWCGRHAVLREAHIADGESFCSPVFADGNASLILELGATCHLAQGWSFGAAPKGRVIGPLRRVGGSAGSVRPAMVGVYFEVGAAPALLRVPGICLTDQVVDLEDVWGSQSASLAEQLAVQDDAARVERLEAILLERVREAEAWMSIDVAGLAQWVRAEPTRMTVGGLAAAAGVSRRHLTRVFSDTVGVSPKRYCRLARFRAGLRYAAAGARQQWAQLAPELGYADQSHMIAEFREFSSLTPDVLATRQWFHPFILEAQARCPR